MGVRSLAAAAAGTCVLAFAAPASAQEDTAGTAANPDRLGPIVVTATRIPAPAEDLAGNTSVIDGDDVALISHDNPAELLNRLPGVYINSNDGQEHLTAIRSPVLTGGAGQGSFLYLEDGIPLRAAGWGNVNGLFDAQFEQAERVEVVRGPGSALYGSNAIHGLINVLTPEPEPFFATTIRGEIGPHRWKSLGDTTGPVGENGAYRATATFIEDDSFRESAGVGQQKGTLRYTNEAGSDRLSVLVSGMNLNQETAGYIQGFEAYKDSTLARTNPNPEAFRDAWSLRTSARWDRDLSPGVTLSLTPYGRVNDMSFLRHFVPDQSLEETGHWSAGLQSAVYLDLDGGHLIVAGADLEYTQGYLTETQSAATFGTFPQGTHYDFEVTQIVAAPYIHSEWQLGDATRLTAGVRFDWTGYDYDNKTTANTVGRFTRPADRKDDYFNVTPKLGVVHKLDETTEIYANLARGARAPQVTDLYRLQANQTVGEIDSETLDSAEIGLRGQWGPAYLSLAAYYAEKENFFFRDADGYNVTDGKTSHRGIEFEGTVDLPADFDFAFAGTYAVHQYEFDRPVSSFIQQTESISSGNDVDTAPRWLGNARLGWDFMDGARAELEWRFVDRFYVDAANTNSYDGHGVFNLRLRGDVTENVALTARVMNLTNVEYAERADFAFGNYRYFPGEPRSVYVGAAVSF